MLDCLDKYDVGYFDLIIADESHRGIYNRYREIFRYFDALQLGLTATPQDLINKDTYSLFECDSGVPTAFYSYEDAIRDRFLSTFRVRNVSSPLRRNGFKYSEMTEDQRRQIEEQEVNPESVEYDTNAVDRLVFNRDSNKRILQDLMECGVRVKEGSQLGKTIIFARNHEHAVFLNRLFDECYPQYGGKFCQVIDNYDPRAESLIDEFKENKETDSISIAISVDMLDTGIDVPEIVNLVFAKPVFSKVKFWQMIGRGTRLCKNLFGAGKDKEEFLIFDYWGNFEHFDELKGKEGNGGTSKSLQQRLFENRVILAKTAIENHNEDAFRSTIKLISDNIHSLPEKTVAIREKWKSILLLQKEGVLEQFSPQTQNVLLNEIAPLMQWCNIAGSEAAWNFDLLCCVTQIQKLKNNSLFSDRRDNLIDWVLKLNTSINAVRAKSDTIEKVKSVEFWNDISVETIETVRENLRGVMKYTENGNTNPFGAKIYDVTEEERRFADVCRGYTYFERGDVIIAKITPCLQNGKAAFADKLKHKIGFGTTEFHVLRPKPETDGRYLFYMIWNPFFRFLAEKSFTGSAGQKRLPADFFSRFEIPLPPLAEQIRLAAILDEADAIRKTRAESLRLLDELVKSTFLDMFGDPNKNIHGFPVGTIRDLASEVKYGSSKKAGDSGQWPILRMNNITYDGNWDFSDLKYIDLSEQDVPKYTVSQGDILFNRTNSKELVGKTAVFPALQQPMAFAGYLVRLRTNSKATPEYIGGFLNSSYGKSILRHMCKSIIGMANINAQELQNITILIPPLSIQQKFAYFVAEVGRQRELIRSALAESKNLFASLSQRAFRGEL